MKCFAIITFTFAAVAIAAVGGSRTLTLQFTITRCDLVKTVQLTFTIDKQVNDFYNVVDWKTNTGESAVAIRREVFFQNSQLDEFRDSPENCTTIPLEANVVESNGVFTKTTIFEEMRLDFRLYGHTTQEIYGLVDVGHLAGLPRKLYLQKKTKGTAVVPQDAISYAVLSYKHKV